ncbi:hypothetical protein WISP_35293 [Willisornis vidua]|uniref:Serine-threonine/tyrosine-protein kinase catalytic domain-containing protein n=1 Tax=Willisornis vidua TaxID=1566151 RepID=A0ABQ9DIR0_9PASS|nr:hypothetical protein WISP_35293 [Willisornis vidua]
MGETFKAIEQVKNGKAAGVDGIPPEIWKHEGQALRAKFHEIIVGCWEQGKLPPDIRDVVIIALYKKEKNQTPQITKSQSRGEKTDVERTIPRQYHLRRRSTVPFETRLSYPASAFLATSALAASNDDVDEQTGVKS